MTDPTSGIQLSSVFPKKARIILCKTDPDPIWMAWSGFGQTHLVWKQDSVLFFHRRCPGLLCAKPARTLIYFWLPVRFRPNGSGPEASRCADSLIRPASSHANAADPDRIRHVYWAVLLTGALSTYYLLFPVWLQKVERLGRYCFYKPLLPQ